MEHRSACSDRAACNLCFPLLSFAFFFLFAFSGGQKTEPSWRRGRTNCPLPVLATVRIANPKADDKSTTSPADGSHLTSSGGSNLMSAQDSTDERFPTEATRG